MVGPTMDLSAWLRKQLEDAEPDLLRDIVQEMAEALMGADVDVTCNATYGERSEDRTNRRNGYRSRGGTRGSARSTSPSPSCAPAPISRTGCSSRAVERRRRSSRSSPTAISPAYPPAGSTSSSATSASRGSPSPRCPSSPRSSMRSWSRSGLGPSPAPPTPWVVRRPCREGQRGGTVSVSVVKAIRVNRDGFREVLGLDVITAEDGAGWLSFLRALKARGLSGVQLAISDDHLGLVEALASVLGASWQRCRTHFARNLLTRVPRSHQPMVATLVRSIFAQASSEEVWAQHGRVVEQLEARFPEAAVLLSDAADDILAFSAFSAFPQSQWRQIWSNNPLERLNKEVRRRTDVVGIFPNRASIVRLAGAVLAEQHDEWTVARRYMSVESLAKARINVIEGEAVGDPKEVNKELEAAS